jgi:hypothetical protein
LLIRNLEDTEDMDMGMDMEDTDMVEDMDMGMVDEEASDANLAKN